MFKLIKWTLIGAVGLGATGYFLLGDNVVSYVSTMASSVKDSVRGEIPIEFELKRAERLIKNIGPQIDRCKLDVARAEVRLDGLVDDVEQLTRSVASAERKLKVGEVQLTSSAGQAYYELASGRHSRERVELDLERTLERLKTNTTAMKSKQALIKRETRSVSAARSKLDAVRSEEVRLKDLIGQLKTQKAQIDAMKTSSKNFALDDSALGDAKRVLSEVKDRLDVAQKMLEDDLFFEGGPRDHGVARRDIAKEIRAYFNGEQPLVESGEPAGGTPAAWAK